MEKPLYVASDVSKTWRHGRRVVSGLMEVDLELRPSEYVAVVGRSGSGKSTLLQVLAGLERPDEGQLIFRGRDIARCSDGDITRLRRDAFGFVFQAFNLIATLTAAENVQAALAAAGRSEREGKVRALELLEQVGLRERARHLPSELSGGEQQRVAIARAIANRPVLLFADEPTGNLDSTSTATVLQLIRAIAVESGLTVVVATHDPAVALEANRVVTMFDGRLVA